MLRGCSRERKSDTRLGEGAILGPSPERLVLREVVPDEVGSSVTDNIHNIIAGEWV